MIKSIAIKNFKSIYHSEIDLSQFTVLVGPNGAGKSNLIKALAFLSTIPHHGVISTVSQFGGFSNLIPRNTSSTLARNIAIEFRYKVVLPSPDEKKNIPPISVEHELKLSGASSEGVRVTHEKLTFHEALALAQIFQARREKKEISENELIQNTRLFLERGPRGGVNFDAIPPFENHLDLYWEWLGFSFIEKEIESENKLKRFARSLMQRKSERGSELTVSKEKKPRYYSFLDPNSPTIVDYARHANAFLNILGSMRRYDLLLNHLRIEQQVDIGEQLSHDGRNMPSVLRYIRSSEFPQDSWNRIITTLGIITPHISSIKSSSLRTGKEFVEFFESTGNRGIESWETSDGTLRTLAILLALETHPPGGTILIEEPEQNLHPWAMRAIVDHIREVIEERDLQVILTTHSQQVLEKANPNEVLVVSRSIQQGSTFSTLEQIIPAHKISMGEIGELWVQGLLGGVPA